MLPDPRYHDTLVTRFVNNLMTRGKKNVAYEVFYGALELIEKRAKDVEDTHLDIWKKALENITPQVEVKSRRVGGATYQVPVEVRPERKVSLAVRWLIQAARNRPGKSMSEKLANELLDAANNTGATVKRREDTHRMAEANRAFAHYRW